MVLYVFVAIASFSLTIFLTPLVGRLGHHLDIVDRPGGRRAHQGAVPRLGGVALFAAFVITVGVAAWRGDLTAGYSASDFVRLKGLLIGSLGAFLFGLIDDRFDLPPKPQLIFQFLLSLIAVTTLLWLERFTLPFVGYVELEAYSWGAWVYIPLTIFWIMGMMTTVNWLDGLDGLAAGVGAILCLVLAIHMHRVGQPGVALLPLTLLGALLGFLPYNVAPSRVFLGSAGAFFLGYALGGVSLVAGGRVATVLLVMGVPIVDVIWQIFDRLRRRRSPAQADRGHLHFRLLDLGLSERKIVLFYWGFCALFGGLALIVSSRIYKLVALISIGIAVIVVLAWLSRQHNV
ncbi:MAG: undecaprenyl/decaprenyl-phosphate alpha-N-acetylglucosaminyl 1-phosphate transferase [Chloroflexi bacterium]|nr:undecaprenyl/decaprenyl-phosphate alpha-N-acetylglucosaminyl 1-phosphate transferase [Chloroflexota bacterium]